MYKNMIALQEEEMACIYGGRSEEIAYFVETLGMGFGVLAKFFYKMFLSARKETSGLDYASYLSNK
jgi:hypothetical protein